MTHNRVLRARKKTLVSVVFSDILTMRDMVNWLADKKRERRRKKLEKRIRRIERALARRHKVPVTSVWSLATTLQKEQPKTIDGKPLRLYMSLVAWVNAW